MWTIVASHAGRFGGNVLYFLHVVYYGSEFLTSAETPFVLETGKVAKLSPGIWVSRYVIVSKPTR